MPRLDAFRTKEETKTFDIDGEAVEIVYTPGRITGADIDRLKALEADDEADMTPLYNMVCKSIKSWDIEGPLDVDGETLIPAGEVVPVTHEYVRHIPVEFLGTVMGVVQEASQKGPNPTKARKTGRSRRR